jgi:hypothetical protein
MQQAAVTSSTPVTKSRCQAQEEASRIQFITGSGEGLLITFNLLECCIRAGRILEQSLHSLPQSADGSRLRLFDSYLGLRLLCYTYFNSKDANASQHMPRVKVVFLLLRCCRHAAQRWWAARAWSKTRMAQGKGATRAPLEGRRKGTQDAHRDARDLVMCPVVCIDRQLQRCLIGLQLREGLAHGTASKASAVDQAASSTSRNPIPMLCSRLE